LPHAAKVCGRGREVRIQHFFEDVRIEEVGEANDAGARPRARLTQPGLAANRLNSLCFTDGTQMLGTRVSITEMALRENRGDDAMSHTQVGQQVLQQVMIAGFHPQVVMRIDDG